MSKNTKKNSSACDNPAFLCSVSNETKDHFDRLLKKALNKNDKSKNDVDNQNRNIKKLRKPKSTEKETIILNENDNYIDLKESPQNGNFILEKFLTDAVNSKKKESSSPSLQKIPESRKLLNSVTFIKPPVPLIRTAKNEKRTPKPPSREKTFSISSPVLQNTCLINDIERLSTSSKNTYDVDDPKVVTKQKDEDNQSNASRGTYNIYKPDQKKLNSKTNLASADLSSEIPVGDIIIHNNSESRSLVKIVNSNKKQDCNESQTSTILYENETQTEEKDKNSFDEQIEKNKKPKEKSENYKNNLADEQIERKITSDEVASGSLELKDLLVKKLHKKEKIRLDNETNILFKNPLFTYEDLIGVVVYKTDTLLLDSLINHPCVKIHIVDSETGEYLTRSKEMPGESNSSQKIKHIYPLITKAYKLQQNRYLHLLNSVFFRYIGSDQI